jgi:hypothetical protein
MLEKRFGREGMDREFFEWFAGEFEFVGAIGVDRFCDNIRWLAASIPASSRLVLLNGAEVPIDNPAEPSRHLHHQVMNAALDGVVAELPNATICDLRTFVLSEDDLASDIRHYKRHIYLRMAEEIRAAADATDLVFQPEPVTLRLFRQAWRFAGRRKVEIRRLSRRLRGAGTHR